MVDNFIIQFPDFYLDPCFEHQPHTVSILLFSFFIKDFFFNVDRFLKSLLNLLLYCFCFMFWFFGHEACGILAPRPRIEPTASALEGES